MALHQQSFSTFKDHDQGSDISQLKDEIADLKKDREIRAGEYSGFEPSAPPVPMAPPHQQSFLTFKDRDQGSDISWLKDEIADLKKDRDICAGEYNLLL